MLKLVLLSNKITKLGTMKATEVLYLNMAQFNLQQKQMQ